MNSEEFTYWLQGALEMNPEMLKKGMSPQQVKTIQDHLNLVFNKVTPDRFLGTTGESLVCGKNSTCGTSGLGKEKQGSGQLFCEKIDVGTKMAIRAGRNGLMC